MLVHHAVSIGLMAPIEYDQIFKAPSGEPVLNGAAAVPKGEAQRFISVLCPANEYFKATSPGDDQALPFVSQLLGLEVEEGFTVTLNSEDLTSAFNLFKAPVKWRQFFAFSMAVPGWAVMRPHLEQSYVCLTTIPMGWISSVSIVQRLLRTMVFDRAGVPMQVEIRKNALLPAAMSTFGTFAVCYLDSFDELRIVPTEVASAEEGMTSGNHAAFSEVCSRLGLPLNAPKALHSALAGPVVGGFLADGALHHPPPKSAAIFREALHLLAMDDWDYGGFASLLGRLAYAFVFRRPLFSVLEESFGFLAELARAPSWRSVPPANVREEVVLAISLLPLAFSNLRAAILPEISASDASETGGAVACASTFLQYEVVDQRDSADAVRVLHPAAEAGSLPASVCPGCSLAVPLCSPCPTGCGVSLCSMECVEAHRQGTCRRFDMAIPTVGIRGSGGWKGLAAAVCRAGCAVQLFDLDREWASDEGRSKLGVLEADSTVSVEVWIPPTDTFEGTERSARFPMGNPRAPTLMKSAFRKINKVVGYMLKRLQKRASQGDSFMVIHPASSFLWEMREIKGFLEHSAADFVHVWGCCYGGEALQFRIAHNLGSDMVSFFDSPDHLHHFSHRGASFTSHPPAALLTKLAAILASACGLIGEEDLISKHVAFIRKSLLASTARLGEAERLEAETVSILEIASDMKPGLERGHLQGLLRRLSRRGNAVTFLAGPDSSSEVPYPATRWQWELVRQWRWTDELHINFLEMMAVLVRLKVLVGDPLTHHRRIVHVVDSKVSWGALSKGRSSAPRMNALCRRSMVLQLGGDLYPVWLWTISGWMFADEGSRL
jgi:hypothetical protein